MSIRSLTSECFRKSLLFLPLLLLALNAEARGPRFSALHLLSPVTGVGSFFNPNPPTGDENFSALHDGQKVLLTWKGSNKKSFDYYIIEKSKDGTHFSTALIVKGAGHSAGVFDYNDIDFAPYQGISYYRLKQTDYNGNISYSAVLPVNYQYSKEGHLVAAEGKTPDQSEIKKIENKEVLVYLRDAGGNEYTAKVKVSKDADEKLYAMESGQNLSKGSYTVIASSFNALYSQKITVR